MCPQNHEYNRLLLTCNNNNIYFQATAHRCYTTSFLKLIVVVPWAVLKEALYRLWCGVNRFGDSGLYRLGDTSACVNPACQLLLTRRGKTKMDGVGIVFEFYTPLTL